MIKFTHHTFFVLTVFVVVSGCDIFEVEQVQDPNNPTTESVLNGASEAQLRSLAVGLEFRHRTYTAANSAYPALLGVFGREMYAVFNSDPSFWRRWNQTTKPDAEDDPDFFLGVFRPYTAPYNAIAQANLLLQALDNTDIVADSLKNGYRGYANTIKGFQFLIPLQTQYRNPGGSIRTDVEDFQAPGPFLPYDEALTIVRGILDDGYNQLKNAGIELHFKDELSAGLGRFDTPARMVQLNRAIAARAAIYAEDWNGALTALEKSFMSLTTAHPDSMNIGGYHVFEGGVDIFNPLFYTPNQNTNQILMVHPDVVSDTLPGDMRSSKFFLRSDSVFFSGESSFPFTYQINTYTAINDPIPFIRNEELVLIYAEAQAQLNNTAEALKAINLIRNTWGLSEYDGADDLDSLIDEILFQRRYSLFGEGHRWIDMRRYDRLDQINTSLDGGRIPFRISRPLAEINVDNQ